MSLAAVHESGNDVDRGYEQAGGWRRALRRSALTLKQDRHVDCSIAQLQPERHRAGHGPNLLCRLRLQANLMSHYRPRNDEVSDLFASIARDVMPSTRSARVPSRSPLRSARCISSTCIRPATALSARGPPCDAAVSV